MAKKTDTLAFCYASGQIGFSPSGKMPKGALPILRGPNKVLRRFISGVARHSYKANLLLVPGVPEARNQLAGVDALLKFKAWIEPQFKEELAELKTYPWRIAVMIAGSKRARTGRSYTAISTRTGQPWGPQPYRVVRR